jgi:prophage regulatory protein
MRFLRWLELHQKIGLSRPTIWRLESRGEFPRRRQLTGNVVGWLESEVDEWIRSRLTGCPPAPGPRQEAQTL